MVIYVLGSCCSPQCCGKVKHCLQLGCAHPDLGVPSIPAPRLPVGSSSSSDSPGPGPSCLAFASLSCTQTICIGNNPQLPAQNSHGARVPVWSRLAALSPPALMSRELTERAGASGARSWLHPLLAFAPYCKGK